MITVLCITGPTASGKSNLALEFCRKIKSLKPEIISIDSAQIYRHIDIASAKPTISERVEIPHHLVDICDPSEQYSVARFITDANAALTKIISNGGIPIFVGGTMMYLYRFIRGISCIPDIPLKVRRLVTEEGRKIGWEKLHKRLVAIDPMFAGKISVNDTQRIIRGIEVWHHTGKTLTYWKQRKAAVNKHNNHSFKLKMVALVPKNKTDLHKKIKSRFNRMVEDGLLCEIVELRGRNLSFKNSSARLVGVRQAWEFLEGHVSFNEFLWHGETATRRLAKHQLTWLNKFNDVKIIDPYNNSQSQKISICESLL